MFLIRPQDSGFWYAKKIKPIAIYDHGENTIKSVVANSPGKIILILKYWKFTASSSEIYTFLPLTKNPYFILENISLLLITIYLSSHFVREEGSGRISELPDLTLFKDFETVCSKRKFNKIKKWSWEPDPAQKHEESLPGSNSGCTPTSLSRDADSLSC